MEIKGALALSREYFEKYAMPSLEENFPELADRIAAGLAGNGSECFGFDDELSRDHDWGEDFFIWLKEEDRQFIPAVSSWKRKLFADHPGEHPKKRSAYGADVGVMCVGDFYRSLTGCPEGPETIPQWRAVPEEYLAMCVNGEVFIDNAGDFTAVRRRIAAHYPPQWRLKKLAAKCMAIAQTGQYNIGRCAKRGDLVALRAVLSRFQDAAMGAVFLIEKKFMPYYKWAWRALSELSELGKGVADLLYRMCLTSESSELEELAQQGCALIARRLFEEGLTREDPYFFTAQAEDIMKHITDPMLKDLPAQFE